MLTKLPEKTFSETNVESKMAMSGSGWFHDPLLKMRVESSERIVISGASMLPSVVRADDVCADARLERAENGADRGLAAAVLCVEQAVPLQLNIADSFEALETTDVLDGDELF